MSKFIIYRKVHWISPDRQKYLCGDNTAVLEIDKLGSEGIRGGIGNRLETDSCDRDVEWSIFKDSYIGSYLETMSWRGIT